MSSECPLTDKKVDKHTLELANSTRWPAHSAHSTREGSLKHPFAMPEVCTNGCGKPGKFLCSLCHVARYCSGQCQREHWKRGGHKTDCLGRQTDREAAVAAVAKTSSDYYATDIISRAAFGMAAFRDFKQKVAEANEAEVPFLRLPNTVLATIFEALDNRDLVAITAVRSHPFDVVRVASRSATWVGRGYGSGLRRVNTSSVERLSTFSL